MLGRKKKALARVLQASFDTLQTTVNCRASWFDHTKRFIDDKLAAHETTGIREIDAYTKIIEKARPFLRR